MVRGAMVSITKSLFFLSARARRAATQKLGTRKSKNPKSQIGKIENLKNQK
jgi:hypothetical protein